MREIKKIDRGLRHYTPVEFIGQEDAPVFKLRLLTHIELATFEDMENVLDLDTNEMISRTKEVEYKIALATIEEGLDLTESYEYETMLEIGRYVWAISKDPEIEAELNKYLKEQ